MANRFLSQIEESSAQVSTPEKKSPNRFLSQIEGVDFPEPPESLKKSISRTVAQPLLGAAQKFTFPLDIIQQAGKGEALAELDYLEENIPRLKELFPAQFENFKGIDREKYLNNVREAEENFPTQGNVEKLVEEKTGLPLTPKNKAQNLLRLGGTASAFKSGSAVTKGVAGVAAPTISESLQQAGVPEPVADLLGLFSSNFTPGFKSKTKPSGMTERRFEGVNKPTKVTPERAEIIKSSVENDFKGLADKLLEKNKTYSAMKEDNFFKEKVGDLFQEVEAKASEIPGEIHTQDLQSALKKRFKSREVKGITPDEYEVAFRREMRDINKSIPYQEMTPKDLVDQFRKNNKSLKELFEPGKSSAFNRAKRDALLEYNRGIEDVITKKYPDTEFKDLFEFTNKRWQEIMDIEQIDKFVGDLFEGKINYKKARDIFRRDKEHIAKPFKRILGDEGFESFKTLTEDLMSTEKAMGYIKKAEVAGFGDIGKTALGYMVHPDLAKAKLVSKYGKQFWQTLLDKPKLTLTWENALSDMKSGNYSQAEKKFRELDKAFESNRQANPK